MGIYFLIASLLLNTYVGVIFKLFEKYNISNLQGIVINYWICVITGICFSGTSVFSSSYLHSSLCGFSLLNGIAYFLTFVLIAESTLRNGVATTQVANKLSLVIPVLLLFIIYKEPISFIKLAGILLALLAVFFTSYAGANSQKGNFALPLLLFIGSGLLDFNTSYMQRNFLTTTQLANTYLISCFAMAALASTCYLLYKIYKGQEKISPRNIIAGILLGFPNYFSIYTLIRALGGGVLKATALIPVQNIGVVLLSTIVAIIFFKEKLSKQKIIGISLAVVAIILIILGDK